MANTNPQVGKALMAGYGFQLPRVWWWLIPDLYKSNAPPPIQIEQVFADEEILYGDFADPSPMRGAKPGAGPTAGRIPNTIQLAAGRPKVIEFHFSANTFVDAKHVRFRYRLLKVDKSGGQ
jgi:hypothetical protein